jgi:hypothetical protein
MTLETGVLLALFFHPLVRREAIPIQRRNTPMGSKPLYEVVENETGWVLRRADRTPLVEFPTRGQALRAGIAVCRDEGLGRLRIRRSDGRIEDVDPFMYMLDTLEA